METNITPQPEENIKKPKEKRTKYFKIIIPIILLIAVVAIYLVVRSNNLINSYSDKVYPGALVFDKDVSGMSESELRTTLEGMVSDISGRKIVVTVGDNTFEKSYLNLDTTIPYDEFEQEILAYGKDKGFFEKLDLIKKPENRSYEFKLSYNEDKINEFVDSIAETTKIDPTNATIDVSGGAVSVGAGADGYELDKEELVTGIKTTLGNIKGEAVANLTGNLKEIKPTITTEALQTVNTKISTFTTYYPAGPSGHNLEIATANIDNVLLMPGDVFSTEKAIGPTTVERGFIEANTYVNGQVVKGVGGGVCQLASTVYNTELRAGILPTERMNHMMTVAYVPLGLDATLADNLIDLKFKNTYDFPIVVNAYAGGGSVTVEFWSNQDAMGGISYEPKSYVSGLYADTWLYGYDGSGQLVYEKYIDNSRYQPFN